MKKQTSKTAFVMAVILIAITVFAEPAVYAEKRVSKKIAELNQRNTFNQEVNVFTVSGFRSDAQISKTVTSYALLKTNNAFSEIITAKPEYLKLNMPAESESNNFTLLLYKVNISPNGFTLLTGSGKNSEVPADIVNYRGIINNDENSIVSITFSANGIMGLISNDNGNYVLGKIENNAEGLHILYNDRDLLPGFSFDCATNTSLPSNYNYNKGDNPSVLSTKCVNWYWETDYDIFVGKGSVANVTTYINGIFNQVSTLYDNDGMSITLQTLFVWDVTDPYTGPSTSNYLTQFGSYRTSFNGNLAHLIGYQGGGGIAWINGFCSSTSHKMAYSGISSSYQSVPTYSWTVEVMAHEEGHLFGSRHTHDCVWNGNNTKIDACGDVAGYPSGTCPQTVPPTPSGGGTIMSYCHLTGSGINFNLGFGPQPATLMLNNENNSSCLTACTGCNPPAQPGTISGSTSVCASSSQTYSISAVATATSYTWALPSGWSGSSTTTSISVTAGNNGGTISVIANNSCGSSSARTLNVSITVAPAQPGSISGNTTVCQSSSQTYSVSAVSGATSYTWTLPSGWSGTSATNSISAAAGGLSGTVSVRANNSCGSSALRTLSVSVTALPAAAGAISATGGNTKVCPGDTKNYFISAVSGATSYLWTPPTGGVITNGQGTTSVTVNFNSSFSTSGNISVAAGNSCGNSVPASLLISRKTPATPGVISGQAVNVCNQSNVAYSVNNITGMTYNWTFSVGDASIASGQGTNSVTANFSPGYVTGQIIVTANNACGTSNARKLTVKASPAIPGSITGATSVCVNQQGVPYSISPVIGAISYTWTAPSGSRISDGIVTSTTASLTTTATAITVNYKTTAGLLKVKANNACGTSSINSVSIVFVCRESSSNLAENGNGFEILASPNPAHDKINISFENNETNACSFTVLDLIGRTLMTINDIAEAGLVKRQFDVSQLSKGIYMLQVKTGTEIQTLKFIVE